MTATDLLRPDMFFFGVRGADAAAPPWLAAAFCGFPAKWCGEEEKKVTCFVDPFRNRFCIVEDTAARPFKWQMPLEKFRVVHRVHEASQSCPVVHELILGETSLVINFDAWKVFGVDDTPNLTEKMNKAARQDEKELAQFLSEVCLLQEAAGGRLLPTEQMWTVALQVIQAKRLVEKELLSASDFRKGLLQFRSTTTIPNPLRVFADALAELLCFRFDFGFDPDLFGRGDLDFDVRSGGSSEDSSGGASEDSSEGAGWTLPGVAKPLGVAMLAVAAAAAIVATVAFAVWLSRRPTERDEPPLHHREREPPELPEPSELPSQFVHTLLNVQSDSSFQGFSCHRLNESTCLVSMRYEGDFLEKSDSDLSKIGLKAKKQLSEALRKCEGFEFKEEEMQVVCYSQGSVQVWMVIPVLAFLGLAGGLYWFWSREPVPNPAAQKAQRAEQALHLREQLEERRSIVVRNAGIRPTTSSASPNSPNGQLGLQVMQFGAHEHEVAERVPLHHSEPREASAPLTMHASEMLQQIRSALPGLEENDLTQLLLRKRTTWLQAVLREDEGEDLARVLLPHYDTLSFVGLIVVKDYPRIYTLAQELKMSFTWYRSIASTVGQLNPHFERLQAVERLGHELFLIGRDCQRDGKTLQKVSTELEQLLDRHPRVFEILGRRDEYTRNFPHVLALMLEARNSLNALCGVFPSPSQSSESGLAETVANYADSVVHGAARESGSILVRAFWQTIVSR